MTAPIPISSTPPQTHAPAPPANLATPGSSVSVSPQTPFSPLSSLAAPLSPSSATPSASGFFKLFSGSSNEAVGHAMTTQDPLDQQKGFALPTGNSPPNRTQALGISFNGAGKVGSALDDHDEEHDSFEFGDVGHARQGSWGRRAMSMSASSPPAASGLSAVGLGRPSGIAAMLKGLGSPTSPGPGSGAAGTAGEQSLSSMLQQGQIPQQAQAQGMAKSPDAQQWAGVPEMSPLSRTLSGGKSWTGNGVLADQAARGQGLLRRLSLTGAGSSFKVRLISSFGCPPLRLSTALIIVAGHVLPSERGDLAPRPSAVQPARVDPASPATTDRAGRGGAALGERERPEPQLAAGWCRATGLDDQYQEAEREPGESLLGLGKVHGSGVGLTRGRWASGSCGTTGTFEWSSR